MKIVKWVFYGISILCVTNCYADVYSALQYVYDTNPVIAHQRQAVLGANADLNLARSDVKPYLGIAANAGAARTKLLGDTFNYNPTEIGIQAQQNIFKGFSMWAQIKAAKGVLESQKAILYSTQQDVFLSAINAYIDVLNAGQVLKLNKNNQHVLQEYYEYCRDLARVGKLTQTDVAQASARLENAKYQVSSAQAEYDNSIATFNRIYGVVDEQYTEINVARMQDLWPEDIDAAENYAMQNHPTILALQAQESVAKENITVARQSILPSIDVRASVMQLDDLPYLDRVRDGRVGVYLTMPLYDKGVAAASVEKVRFTVGGIQEQIINARRTITENLHRAWNLYNAQTVAIKAAQAGVDASKLALSGTRAEQQRGRRTVLDVLNAEQELLNSQVALVRARHSQISAYFAVFAAQGVLSPENLGIRTDSD